MNPKHDVWFTADTHFGHANVIRYCKRPWLRPGDVCVGPDGKEMWFSSTIEHERKQEMDETLISNWNNRVGKNDLIFHVGDFCFGRSDADFNRYFHRLNGLIVLVKGNHDKLAAQNKDKFYAYHDSGLYETKVGDRKVVLCHYSMKTWNCSHRGSYHLYGHSHGSLPDDPNSLSFDVGVDCHNFAPLHWSEVVKIMEKKTFKPIDHHGA